MDRADFWFVAVRDLLVGDEAVFSHEIDWLLNPDLRANVATAPIDWQAAYDAVRTSYPDWTVREINTPRYDRFAIEVLTQSQPDIDFRVYVDPVTYQVLGDTSYFNVQRFFRSFHMSLFDTGSVEVAGVPLGYLTIALMSFPLLLSITLPLIFYKRWWRGFFKLERNKGLKIFWSDLHKLTGVWSMLVGMIIAITGVWYLAEWWIPDPPYYEVAAPIAGPYAPVNRLITAAQSAHPNLQIKTIYLPDANNGTFMAIGQDGTMLVRNSASVTINAATGALLDRTSPSEGGLYVRLFDTADPLHFGNFAGLWSQVLYFFFGLGLSGLALTGAYLQAKRQMRSHGKTATKWAVKIAYALTTSLMIFATVQGAIEIKGYGTWGSWPEVATPITAFLLAWSALTITALTVWMRKLA